MITRERQHGIAARRKGCDCPICEAAPRSAARRRRARSYNERARRDGDEMCVYCCCWFHPKGLGHHEMVCQGC